MTLSSSSDTCGIIFILRLQTSLTLHLVQTSFLIILKGLDKAQDYPQLRAFSYAYLTVLHHLTSEEWVWKRKMNKEWK